MNGFFLKTLNGYSQIGVLCLLKLRRLGLLAKQLQIASSSFPLTLCS